MAQYDLRKIESNHCEYIAKTIIPSPKRNANPANQTSHAL